MNTKRSIRADSPTGIFLLAMLLQLPLILNPGYFSHDELQWGARAFGMAFNDIDWINPFDVSVFQYRPLTFNLWLFLGWLFFGTPMLLHGVQALFGAGITVLLFRLLGHHGVTGGRRVGACALWLLFPNVIYVHGWVGTFGDQIWLAAALGALLACFRMPPGSDRNIGPVMAGAGATLIGLLAKEAALVIPVFLCVYAWLLPDRRRLFALAAFGSILVTVIYLLLRLKVILHGATASGDYEPVWHDAFARIAEYWTYPAMTRRLEPYGILNASGRRLAMSIGTLSLLFVVVLTTRWRYAALLMVLPALALGPTLVLAHPAAQYGYGFATVIVIVLASVSMRATRTTLICAAPWVLMVTIHGIQIAGSMHEVGRFQARLLPTINALVTTQPGKSLRIRSERPEDGWRIHRTLRDVPGWRGVPWDNRVVAVAFDDPTATHIVDRNGKLRQLR